MDQKCNFPNLQQYLSNIKVTPIKFQWNKGEVTILCITHIYSLRLTTNDYSSKSSVSFKYNLRFEPYI